MQETDLPFDDLPSSRPRASGRLVLRQVAESTKPLSRRQRQFNRLVTQIEKLREQIARTRVRLDGLLAEYVARVHPLRREEHRVRRGLVRALADHWRKQGTLGRRQRSNLRDLLLEQFDLLEEHPPAPEDADLFRIAEELEQDAAREAKARRKKRGGNWLDDDSEDLDPDEFAAIDQESAEEMYRDFAQHSPGGTGTAAEASTGGKPPPRKRTAAQLRREQREAELASARKRDIATIYKQLAKVLHPDLERDPVRRTEKIKLMQQLTEAHRAGDMHTLLRLELEFIHGEERRSWTLGEERLALYCELLKEQVAELEDEKSGVVFDPRYTVFIERYWPHVPGLRDLESWAVELRGVVDSMAATQVRLDGPDAKKEIREALADFAAHRRQRRRAPPFDDFV